MQKHLKNRSFLNVSIIEYVQSFISELLTFAKRKCHFVMQLLRKRVAKP